MRRSATRCPTIWTPSPIQDRGPPYFRALTSPRWGGLTALVSGRSPAQVFDTNGNGGPTAWWNGRIVGGWRQNADAVVQLQLLEDVGRDGRKALERKATELTQWLDGTQIRPRFPTPLSKAEV